MNRGIEDTREPNQAGWRRPLQVRFNVGDGGSIEFHAVISKATEEARYTQASFFDLLSPRMERVGVRHE